jgi:hypothetical protein
VSHLIFRSPPALAYQCFCPQPSRLSLFTKDCPQQQQAQIQHLCSHCLRFIYLIMRQCSQRRGANILLINGERIQGETQHTNIDKAGTEVIVSGFSRDRLRSFCLRSTRSFSVSIVQLLSLFVHTKTQTLRSHKTERLSAIRERKGEELAWMIVMCLLFPSFTFSIY